MKEVWIFIKSLWTNKRTRAISVLILWFFFFLFVYFFINTNKPTSNPEIYLTGWDAFEKVEQYHFQITMEEVVSASYNKGIHVTYNDMEYEESTIPSNLENYQILFWNPSNLRKIIEKATLVSTNYVENKDTYQLVESIYPLVPWENVKDITIEVYKKEDIFYKIIIEQKELPFYLEWEVKE